MVLDASNFGSIWETVLERIKQEVVDDLVFSTYFEGTYIDSINIDTITIVSPSRFGAQMLNQQRYHETITQHINDITQTNFKVVIVDKETIEKKKNEETDLVQNGFIKNDKPLDSRLNPKFTFENFISGPSNREANVAAVSAATNPGNFYNPLFIFGKSGLGKTHLLHAIGNYIKTKNPSMKVLYLNTNDFFEEYVKAVKEKSVEEFKNTLKEIDILLLDDIQFLASKEKTREVFFDVFNLLTTNNKQIVLTADRPPQELRDVEARLVGRFEAGLSVEIQTLEYETALQILKSKIINQNINDGKIDEDVLVYIAKNYSSNVRQLEGALNKLIFYAISFKTQDEINMETALETFKSFESSRKKNEVNIDRIKLCVAEYYNISVSQLTSKIRQSHLVTPRHIAMYLCKNILNSTLNEIGDAFGGRDHTTVINAVNKIENLLKTDESYLVIINELKKIIIN